MHRLRALPSVQRLLESQHAAPLIATASRGAVTLALRTVLDHIRSQPDGPVPEPS